MGQRKTPVCENVRDLCRMKIDRLYALTIYLLNHGKTPASELAKKFEVSVRTVQRDMDALCQAGIPVVAELGAAGGYALTDAFRMDRQLATQADYSFILTALKGFASAMANPKIDETLEKISALVEEKDNSVILDFSVLREGDAALVQTLQAAIRTKRPVRFTYTNADHITRSHTVEPIALVYRWYAWYLLAYSTVKGDYRTYKLVRMRSAALTDAAFTKKHASADAILRECGKSPSQPCTAVTIRCQPEAKAAAIEYLNGKITCEHKNGDCEMTLQVIENEHFWFGTLLALGDGVEILEPEHIRARVLEAAKKIVLLYGKL